MSRRLNLPEAPALFTISETGGVWEKDWEVLRGSHVASLFSRTTRRVVDEAVRGHVQPLLQALSISPEGALRKLPSRECQHRKVCSFFKPSACRLLAPKLPWCFVPANLGLEESAQDKVSEVVSYWRDQVYVVVVEEY